MKLIEHLIAAAQAQPRRIVLCEADDERILRAASQASQDGIARITLVGDTQRVGARLQELGLDQGDVQIEDPQTSLRQILLSTKLIERASTMRETREETEAIHI